MFVPKIIKICPTDGADELFIEWTTPDSSAKCGIVGYILAYRRSDLDLNYSSRTLIGRHVCSTVIPCSRVSLRYDIKISAFTYRQFGDFSTPITWSAAEYEETKSKFLNLLPRPEIERITSTNNGYGIHVYWKIPCDVSSMIIEGFIVKYKRCSLDTAYKEKLIPGSDVTDHVIIGVNRCTLYEVRVAACTNDDRGKFSIPVILRTGVTLPDSLKVKSSPEPQFIPKILKLCCTLDPPGIYISWATPEHTMYPPVVGYVIAYRKVKAYELPYFKCYVRSASSSFHVIKIMRTNTAYEIKIAAYNACGVGTYTLPRILHCRQPEQKASKKPQLSLAPKSLPSTSSMNIVKKMLTV